MAGRIGNPFVLTGYVSPEYFCDRKAETEKILDCFHNGQNVVLTSPRRMGKTGLIHHVFRTIENLYPESKTIYIDIYPTESLADFSKVFSSSVFSQMDSDPMKIMKKILRFVKGIRPNLSQDEITGKLKVGVDIAPGEEVTTIAQIFEYLERSGKECLIAFDEFQKIASYPETNLEAILRSNIQNCHNVKFIFSGSQAHMLGEMFLSPNRPFYQSATNLNLGVIPEESYYDFASGFFMEQGRPLPKEVFDWIYTSYEGHTWYIQKILNSVYGQKESRIDKLSVGDAINNVLLENEYYYQGILRSYTQGQAKLMKAIAKEGVVKEITSGAFISSHKLTATSSVKAALRRLIDDEVVYSSEEGYSIYDRFFGQWLRQTY